MPVYRGRFAPSPSGPLHFGSLIAAVGSFLHAKIHQGKWLVRIEDIDQTRVVTGAADDILRTLAAFELHWDDSVRYQTQHLSQYDAILELLCKQELLYSCDCTRKMIKTMGGIYDKRCRKNPTKSLLQTSTSHHATALRFKNDHSDRTFFDENLGWVTPEQRFVDDDVILKRRDGLHAYQLAVVVDDIAQDITHVVRGADLLDLTPVQKNLFHKISASIANETSAAKNTELSGSSLFSLSRIVSIRQKQQRITPHFLHLPLAVTAPHQKLSKQNHATALNLSKKERLMHKALTFLGVPIPSELQNAQIQEQLAWSITKAKTWRFVQQTEVRFSDDN